MDTEYLKTSVGKVLAQGIAETVSERPEDPIAYLAAFLLKSVDDEKADKVLTVEKKKDAEVTTAAAAAAAAADAVVSEKAVAGAEQATKEDNRLTNLLDNAASSDEVFMAVLSFVRARTGAGGYVMLTDLPEKIMPKKVPEAPPSEEPAEYAEGEEPPPPPPEPEEPPEPPPKFKPTALEYVTATSSDEALLIGKMLTRPAPPAEEDADAPPAPPADGEGVTFTAIDDYLAGGAKVYHEAKAVENRAVKFWYMPRLGAYACAPFTDYEDDVFGVLGFDTLGLERAFTAKEIAMMESLAVRTADAIKRIETGLSDKHHELMDALAAAYPKDPETGAFPAAPPAEEGGDAIEAAKAAVALPAAALAPLTDESVVHLATRRNISEAYLMVLKGVLALTTPEHAEDLLEGTWEGIKESVHVGDLTWGTALFQAIGSFDVMAGSGGTGWETAKAMATALATPPEEGEVPKDTLAADPNLLLAKVLCDWLLATVALYAAKVDKEAAEKAAAEPPAEEEAAQE